MVQANGYTGLAGNAALENGLAYQNALANGVNSNALGTLPLFGEGAAPNCLYQHICVASAYPERDWTDVQEKNKSCILEILFCLVHDQGSEALAEMISS